MNLTFVRVLIEVYSVFCYSCCPRCKYYWICWRYFIIL